MASTWHQHLQSSHPVQVVLSNYTQEPLPSPELWLSSCAEPIPPRQGEQQDRPDPTEQGGTLSVILLHGIRVVIVTCGKMILKLPTASHFLKTTFHNKRKLNFLILLVLLRPLSPSKWYL